MLYVFIYISTTIHITTHISAVYHSLSFEAVHFLLLCSSRVAFFSVVIAESPRATWVGLPLIQTLQSPGKSRFFKTGQLYNSRTLLLCNYVRSPIGRLNSNRTS